MAKLLPSGLNVADNSLIIIGKIVAPHGVQGDLQCCSVNTIFLADPIK